MNYKSAEDWSDENGGIKLLLIEHKEVSDFIALFAKQRGYSVINLQVEEKSKPPKNKRELLSRVLPKPSLLYADDEVGEDVTEDLLRGMKKQRKVPLGSIPLSKTARSPAVEASND